MLKAQYCIPTYTNTCKDGGANGYYFQYIDGFTLNTIDTQKTSCNYDSINYVLYSKLNTILIKNFTYDFSIIPGTASDKGLALWIDWDQDGDFNDSLEHVYSSELVSSQVIGSITVPSFALPGLTRLRIRSKNQAVITTNESCDNFDRGETEDFNVIIDTSSTKPLANFTAKSTLSCNGKVEFVDLSTQNTGSWLWFFGDGTSDTIQNPLHQYSNDGIYNVTLIASNFIGSDTNFFQNYITISMQDTSLCRACATKVVEKQCIENSLKYDSSEFKYFYLHFLVVRDDSGNGNGNITQSNIDSLVFKLNNFFFKWRMQFCSYSTNFINDSKFIYIVQGDSLSNLFTDLYVKNGGEEINVCITDISTLGWSGVPIFIDYSMVANYNATGVNVLAHELGHNFSLVHVSDPANLMYTSTGGTLLDSIQVGKMHCFTEPPEAFYIKGNVSALARHGEKVCNRSAKPFTRFSTEINGGCAPLTVQFYDNSSINPNNWFWDFGDGFTDNVQNPLHIFTQAGKYDIKLIASNDNGSDTLIKTDYLIVTETTQNLPIIENFEDSIFPPDNWYFINPEGGKHWSRTDLAFGNRNHKYKNKGSAWMEAWYEEGYAQESFVSAKLNLEYVINPYMIFDISYPANLGGAGGLLIYASSDCGNNENLIYVKGTDSICTYSFDTLFCYPLNLFYIDYLPTTNEPIINGSIFFPCKPEHWRTDTVDLSAYQGNPSVQIKFTYYKNFIGNNIYLDDILISADKISGLPVADFMADTTTIYKNDTIHFTNLSNKYSDTLQWFFTGATITTSNDTNPSIIYDSAGIFPVTLVAWNMFGRDTLTKLAYINVLQKIIDTIPCDSMKISLSKNDLSCKNKNDGTVTASAFNGNSDYTFSWSTGDTTNSISSLAAGTYTVTVTDSIGCIKTAYITITEPPILSSNLAYSNVSCLGGNDGNVVVSTYGGNGYYSYLWSTGDTINIISDLTTGTYTVTVTDSIGCTKTDSIKISYIDSLPAADFSYADTGNTVNFTNLSTNADSSLWNFGDDSTDNSANPTHMYSDYGTYEACLIALNICGADTLCKSISIIDGIKENTGKINLQIFPNPNSGTFTIIVEQPTASEISITLTNILGQKIYTNKAAAKVLKDELNLTNFSKGLYSMKIVTNNESVSRKVVYR